jgi:alkylation response protein AidB-like acyl-CoA dehydrogenase
MQFELDAEQEMLARSVEQLLARSHGQDRWAQFAGMGLLGLPFPEHVGGFNGGGTEAMIVMEAIGRSLADEPYLSCVLLAGTALLEGGRTDLAGPVIAGERKLTLAHTEPQSRYDLADVASTARREGSGWVLDGEKIAVLDAAGADLLLVSARGVSARVDGDRGVTLFVVARDNPEVSIELRTGPDGRSAGNVTLGGVRVPDSARVGAEGDGLRIVRAAVDKAIAGACAEAVGAMARLLDITVEHLKTRKQFAAPLGSFQALQHRAADMLCELELARSMAMYAALMSSAPDPRARRSAIAAAKVQISAAARFVGQQAIQLHGGMGMSEEYPAGRYFKRLTLFERLFGDENHFLREIDRGAAE